mgnify:FL=1
MAPWNSLVREGPSAGHTSRTVEQPASGSLLLLSRLVVQFDLRDEE